MGRVLGATLSAAVVLLLLLPAVHSAGDEPRPKIAQETQGSGEVVPDKVGHREDPVDPPAVPVTREGMTRSIQAVVVRGQHQSIQINVDNLQQNIVGDAANEPSIAIDPTNPDNIVIGWRQFGTISSDFRQAGMAYSHDGGATWTFPGPLDPAQFRSDPVLEADSAGDFYYYSLSSVTTTEYFISTDKGVNWTGPTSSPGGDKNWQTIDVSGGIGDGHIYPIWNSQFTCCAAGTDFTRSTDFAMTFDGPYVLPQHPKWGTNDVGPDGELYIVGATLSAGGHLILRSDNAQDELATPTFTSTSIDLGGLTTSSAPPNPGGLAGQVWVAVDRSSGPSRGNVYVTGSVNPPGSDPLDLHFIRSTDGGQNWSSPIRINDDATDNGAYQWFGTLSVSPAGRIDVVWNDTRAGTATMSELYYAYSTDQGTTWSAGLPVSPSYDSTVGHPVQNKIGDYYDMVSLTDYAGLAYSATFNGEQDTYYLEVGDCNANGLHDSTDLTAMTSADVNTNGIPDECEADCNSNGVPDGTDITMGTSEDCNRNTIPDECDISGGGSEDCDGDGTLDECDVSFDLELDPGFTVGAGDDTATTGVWVRVDPVGTTAQPEDDHTPTPGTMAYVTGQGAPGGGLGDADVDGGKTTLFSPTLNVSTEAEPWIGYWRWYSNNTGGAPGADTFVVDISNDGGQNWTNVETVGPSGPETVGGWFFHIFRVSDRVTPTSNVVLRFVASDLGTGSVVEAAVDDLVIVDCAACQLTTPQEIGILRLGLSGVVADLTWDTLPDAATYNVYRGQQRTASDLSCFLNGITGNTTDDDGTVPAAGEALFHVVTGVNCAGESTLGAGRFSPVGCP